MSRKPKVGYPYQIARNGRVNEPSRTSPTRHTMMPRLSHLCIPAHCFVVPSGRSSAMDSTDDSSSVFDVLIESSLFREDFAVDGVQIRNCEERGDVHDV